MGKSAYARSLCGDDERSDEECGKVTFLITVCYEPLHLSLHAYHEGPFDMGWRVQSNAKRLAAIIWYGNRTSNAAKQDENTHTGDMETRERFWLSYCCTLMECLLATWNTRLPLVFCPLLCSRLKASCLQPPNPLLSVLYYSVCLTLFSYGTSVPVVPPSTS